MNPKFDAGVHPEKAGTVDLYLERGVVPDEVNLAQLLGIFDQMLITEVTFVANYLFPVFSVLVEC